MGITIKSKNFSVDMGYLGFNNFRTKVAELSNSEFWLHYKDLNLVHGILDGQERKKFFEKYNEKTEKLIKRNIVSEEIANFCYQSDCEGSIDQDQSKQIYEKIKDYDDNFRYGYVGRSDCAMFSDLKNIFKDCAENGGTVDWR